jgi:hypothetical protein
MAGLNKTGSLVPWRRPSRSLSLAASEVIARGSSFAFLKVAIETWTRRIFGAGFTLPSVVAPFFLAPQRHLPCCRLLAADAPRTNDADLSAQFRSRHWLPE